MSDWIPVINGVMPKEIADCRAGEWAFRRIGDGQEFTCELFSAVSTMLQWQIMSAVRDLRPKKEPTEAEVLKQWCDNEEDELIAQGLLDPWHRERDQLRWATYEDYIMRPSELGGWEFRLTHCWLYVVGDGSIPEDIKGAKGGEWEIRFRDGSTTDKLADASLVIPASWKHTQTFNDIVAVRRIVPKKLSAQEALESCKPVVDHPEDKSGYEYTYAFIDAYYVESTQRRLTREAYERYKAKQPVSVPFRSLGEAGIDEAAAMACKEHKL